MFAPANPLTPPRETMSAPIRRGLKYGRPGPVRSVEAVETMSAPIRRGLKSYQGRAGARRLAGNNECPDKKGTEIQYRAWWTCDLLRNNECPDKKGTEIQHRVHTS